MTTPDPEKRPPPPTEAQVRAAFMAFASMIRRLDSQGQLLPRLPLLMGRLGDLRHMVFEYEVRVTERLVPEERDVEEDDDPTTEGGISGT